MNKRHILIAVAALSTWGGATFAQQSSTPLPSQRVSLSASAQVTVAQDTLTMVLSTTREAIEAQTVQSQLKAALDSALALSRKDASKGQMEVHTGRFGLYPRYGRDNKITGWQGSAELVLEGQDFGRISATAGKLSTLNVASVSLGLTPAQRQTAQAQAQEQAIALFRQRASEIAKSFGFGSYTLGEISVNYEGGGPIYRPQMMTARAVAAESAVPVEAGQTQVSVSVSGSVQLQ